MHKSLAAAACALALASVANAQEAMPGHAGHATTSASAAGDPASTLAFKEVDTAMMRGMNVPYTGDPDVDFRTHMIPHHQSAIDMAKVALAHAKDDDTKALAQKIIDDQEREIAEMKDWLAKNKR